MSDPQQTWRAKIEELRNRIRPDHEIGCFCVGCFWHARFWQALDRIFAEADALPAPMCATDEVAVSKALDELEQRIPEIADRFAPFYASRQWHWTVCDGGSCPGYIPSAGDIAGTLIDLMTRQRPELLAVARYQISTGGLCLWRDGESVGISFEDAVSLDATMPRFCLQHEARQPMSDYGFPPIDDLTDAQIDAGVELANSVYDAMCQCSDQPSARDVLQNFACRLTADNEALRAQLADARDKLCVTKPCVICRWPNPPEDSYGICICCGFQEDYNDPSVYSWNGEWWFHPEGGDAGAEPPEIVKRLEAQLLALRQERDTLVQEIEDRGWRNPPGYGKYFNRSD